MQQIRIKYDENTGLEEIDLGTRFVQESRSQDGACVTYQYTVLRLESGWSEATNDVLLTIDMVMVVNLELCVSGTIQIF